MDKMMKLIGKISWGLLLLMTGWLGGCGGSDGEGDPEPGKDGLVLQVDKNTVANSGQESVKFTVLLNGKDVTASSSIAEQKTHKEYAGGIFTPTPNTTPGIYTFKATYQKMTSPAVEVTVTAAGFVKNVLLMEFTSTSCIYCPGLASTIEDDILPKAAGRFCVLAFHGRSEQAVPDPMEKLDYVSAMQQHFSMNASFPKLLVEHDFIWDRVKGDLDPILKYTEQSAVAGLALQTSLSGRQLTVTVKAKAVDAYAAPCSVAVVLTEDGIQAMQSYPTGMPQNIAHNHVVREYLTDLFGDKENTGSGQLTGDQEWSRTWQHTLPAGWNVAKMSVVAYVLDANGKALNCRMVKAGENADYQK